MSVCMCLWFATCCSYNKFLRGKDISGYSSNDMSCIFGERGATDKVGVKVVKDGDCLCILTVSHANHSFVSHGVQRP